MTDNKNYEEVKKLIDGLINKCSHGKHIFRGINFYSKRAKVGSSLFREYEKDNIWNMYFSPKQAEKEIVEKAKRLFSPNTNNVEILTDLRHYGGKVNFIDFTLDLYVALFFACNGKINMDGQLVILKSDNLRILSEGEDIKYEKSDKIVLIKPAKTSTSWNRVTAQKSIFVYSTVGYIPKNQCTIVRIKHKYKKEILEYLSKFHNISSDTIYNDLIGFIENKDNFSSAYTEFYKALSLWEEAKTKNNKEKYQKAIDTYDKAIELKPDLHIAYYNRGLVKFELKQYNEAIDDFNKAIKLEPDDVGACYMRGLAKFALKQYNEAIVDYNKAIELDPNDVGAYYSRGITKYKLKQYNEAIIDFNTAVMLKPGDAEIYHNRGIAKYKLNQYDGAIADYNKAIELKPVLVSTYKERGIAKNELKQYNEAIDDFNKAIKLKPDDIETYNNRGIAKNELKQCNEAIDDFNKAIELNSKMSEAYYNRGCTKDKLGLYGEAISDLEKAIKLEPKSESKLRPRINKLKAKSSLSE